MSLPVEGMASRPATGRLLGWAWRIALGVLVALVLVLAWLVGAGHLYDAGSDLGYNLGLLGGLLMLSLLSYPLRKRIRALERLGRMEWWFRYHMMAGILGPLLILFHSTFRIGSMNARVALYAMLLVVFSGLVGRYLYRHLHRGLYGRQLSLSEEQAELKASMERLGSVYSLQADIESRLTSFHDGATMPPAGLPARLWHFMTLRARGGRLARSICRDAKHALWQLAKEGRLSPQEARLNYRLAKAQITRYLDAVVSVSQLKTWERLFSLWHIVHIPFLYLLLLSGIIHVVAVHMY
ncbi:MAG: pyridine nucleotide-disulfide oxidoreductase [Pseudomonadota bacterium]